MSVSENTGGTQTATLDVEHTLATITDAGEYQLVVDTANLVNGETLELRIKTKVRTGATSRLAFMAVYQHAQGEPNKYSMWIPSTTEFVATLKQSGGTGRAFPWSIYQKVRPTATENADTLLKRDMSAVTGEAARSPLNALRALRNRVTVSETAMVVYEEDDSTQAWTATVSTGDRDPISEIDPG